MHGWVMPNQNLKTVSEPILDPSGHELDPISENLPKEFRKIGKEIKKCGKKSLK